MKKNSFLAIIVLVFSVSNAQTNMWKKTNFKGNVDEYPTERLDKNNSQTFQINFSDFKNQLRGISKRKKGSKVFSKTIELPNGQSQLEIFTIYESSVFSKSLSEKYPEIKSYLGFSKSGAIVRMSVSHKGVQTMISHKDKPTVFMDPLRKGDVSKYIVYNRLAKSGVQNHDFLCYTKDDYHKSLTFDKHTTSVPKKIGDQTFKKFRLAVAVNGEYTAYHGGTVVDALAAINATITRVNAIFETDLAVTFEVQDFSNLIFRDATTDPFSNKSSKTLQLQKFLTSTIGNEAYDIGHLFSGTSGSSNAGCIGCVCRDDDPTDDTDRNKGAAFSSPSTSGGIPEGDIFDIDIVAHEIGHQMGASHTFTGTGESNLEPGSGSTIMSYAGNSTSNVELKKDPYFHYYNIKQISDVLETNTCWLDNSPVSITNKPPQVNAGLDYTIPQGTAYVLRGVVTNTDDTDLLTYCWEQVDSGRIISSTFGSSNTIGPMVRSLPPRIESFRYIPKLSRIVTGQLTEINPVAGADWETVPTVSRDLNFALTVRDRAPSVSGLNSQIGYDTMKITVDDTKGPFVVTSQTTNEVWNVGSTQTITWDVAGTDSGAINSQKVNIYLSLDGGLTFPQLIASEVDNNGSHNFNVPDVSNSTSARIMVAAADNIFLAVNSSNFSIEESLLSTEDFAFKAFKLYPNPSNGNFTLSLEVLSTDNVTINLFDLRGRKIDEKKFNNVNSKFLKKLSFSNVTSGLYLLNIINDTKQITRKIVIE